MANSKTLYKDLQKTISTYKGLPGANAGDVYSDLSARVDNFKPQYKELRNTEAQAYAMPTQVMQEYQQQQQGQGGYGPSALSQLNGILNRVGQMYGTANVMRDSIGESRGRLQDMTNDVLGQYNAMREDQKTLYGMQSPLYQSALSSEENEKNRAAARSNAARAASASQFDFNALLKLLQKAQTQSPMQSAMGSGMSAALQGLFR
jgi:hypothetical protein